MEGLRESGALLVEGVRESEAWLELECLLALVFACLQVLLLLWQRVKEVAAAELQPELRLQPGMQAVQFQQVPELCRAVERPVAAARPAVCHACW